MNSISTERKKEIATGLFVIVAVLFIFGGGEGALRIQQLTQFGILGTVETSDHFFVDKATGLRLPRPNSVQGKIRINSLGFRGPEVEIPKPPDIIRIAFLGASGTYDPYVDLESTWTYLTWQRLQEAFPGCRFDYVNAGTPGLGTAHAQIYFNGYIAHMEPDIVVIDLGDIAQAAGKLARAKGVYNGTHFSPSWLANRSILWFKIEKNIVIIQRQRKAHSSIGKLVFEPRKLSWGFERRLETLVETVRKTGSIVALMSSGGRLRREQSPNEQIQASTWLFYLPYLSIEGYLNAQNEFNRVKTEVAMRTDALLIKAHEKVPADLHHYADDIHFLAPATRIVANEVAETLLSAPKFRALLKERTPNCLIKPPTPPKLRHQPQM